MTLPGHSAVLLTFPFSGWLRFPLWSKGRSPSHGKNRRGTRQISRPNNARRNFLSEIAVPNIIDNWYDTRLVALLEFYRDPTRERNCLSSRIVSFRVRKYCADTAHITQCIHCEGNVYVLCMHYLKHNK